jgi:hypothetical protein
MNYVLLGHRLPMLYGCRSVFSVAELRMRGESEAAEDTC